MTTKERVKNCALSLFASSGYEATTMNQIADIVGIKKPSLYAHYGGKEEIFFSIFEDLIVKYKGFIEQVIDSTSGMTVEKKLLYIFENYINFFIQNPEVSTFWNRVLFFPPIEFRERIFASIFEMEIVLQGKLASIFIEGIKEGVIREEKVEDMILSFLCIREGLLLSYQITPEMDPKKIKIIWNNYWQGVKARK
nr:TetR/AcrR family transcriptional regulator [Desulforamulus aquiferis]